MKGRQAVRLAVGVLLLAVAGCSAVALPTFESPVVESGAGASVVERALAEFLLQHGRRVTVERVIDGDTIAVTGDERVRLLTVDAPELRSTTRADDADPCAEQSHDALAAYLPPGTEVIVGGLKGEPDQDRYGRTLANLYVDVPSTDGQLINVSVWLAAQGHALAYLDYPTSDTDLVVEQQEWARDHALGVWGTCPD